PRPEFAQPAPRREVAPPRVNEYRPPAPAVHEMPRPQPQAPRMEPRPSMPAPHMEPRPQPAPHVEAPRPSNPPPGGHDERHRQ
ncbi:hypothetical protein FU139_05325, partial [Burkholderia territorii]